MSALAEKTLLSYLSDSHGCAYLAKVGVPEEIIPTPSMRRVVRFGLDYYAVSGKAPSVAVLIEEFADDFEAAEITLEDFEPDESVEWSLALLKANWVRKDGQAFANEFTEAVTLAEPHDRVDVVAEFAAKLSAKAMLLQPRTRQVDFRTDGDALLAEYDYRKAHQGEVIGSSIGLDEVDEHIGGVWPGEVAVIAAGTKIGKSWMLDWISLTEWQRGRIGCLFTLENSIEMTQGRIACLALHLDPTEWQRGLLDEEDEKRIREWVEDVLKASDTPLLIFNPTQKMRTPQAMFQVAKAHDAETVMFDQLTFMKAGTDDHRSSRAYEVGEIMHDCKELASTGSTQISTWIAHQVNREGIKAAEKVGYLEAYHMADSSEVERSVDHLFGIYQSLDDKVLAWAKLQYMLGRRATFPKTWLMTWNMAQATLGVRQEIDLSDYVTTSGEAA